MTLYVCLAITVAGDDCGSELSLPGTRVAIREKRKKVLEVRGAPNVPDVPVDPRHWLRYQSYFLNC